jgi:dephospho-CoA kinase
LKKESAVVIGLAGKYCSGKSSLVPFFEDWGCQTINMDQLGHQALEANKDRILHVFGHHVLESGEEGQTSINRKALAKVVFSKKSSLNALESISHPWMVQRTREIIQISPRKTWLIDAALLFPMKLDQLCNIVFFIQAPFLARLKRGLNRDKRGLWQTLKRMLSQDKIRPQPSSEHTDVYKVWNRNSVEDTWEQIRTILDKTPTTEA